MPNAEHDPATPELSVVDAQVVDREDTTSDDIEDHIGDETTDDLDLDTYKLGKEQD